MTRFDNIHKEFLKMLEKCGYEFEVLDVGDDEDNWIVEVGIMGEADPLVIRMENITYDDLDDEIDFEDRVEDLERRVASLEMPWSVPSILGKNTGLSCPNCKSFNTIMLISTSTTSTDYPKIQWVGTSRTSYQCNDCGHVWSVPNSIDITYSGSTACCQSKECGCVTESQTRINREHKRY